MKTLEKEKDIVIFKGTGKVFCSGGDVKQIASLSVEDLKIGYTNGYRSFDLIANYRKPYVALMDGLAMGGAAYYSVSGRFTVATERTLFAMPETVFGYFNDAGASHFLSRLDNNFGFYVGMAGARVKGFDVKKVGLASHYIESGKMDEVEKSLIGCKTHEDVKLTLDKFSSAPVETELVSILPKVKKCFGGATVEEIFENLQLDGSDWAKKTIKTLNKMSPTSLKVTHRSISLGKDSTLRDSLKKEFRLVVHHVLKSDLKEGVRALLIDKDFKPQWNPKSITEVTEQHVARFFEPSPDGDELTFETSVQSKL